jgi:hypothetical protein
LRSAGRGAARLQPPHRHLHQHRNEPVQIDTTKTATDTIHYMVTDQNSLTSTSTRTVIIEPARSNANACISSYYHPRPHRNFFSDGVRSMTRLAFVTGTLSGALFALAAVAAEITELPQGPNRDLVSKVCQSCHDLQMVFDAAGISRNEWDMSLDEMTANGMNISTDDRAKILEYLSTYLGPAPPKPAATP